MKLVDMEKLETAIIYMQRISDGKNPINNMPVDDVVLNNPNVTRCMEFVKEILEEVKYNDGYIGRKPRKNKKKEFPIEILDKFEYKEDKAISKFVAQINEMLDKDVYKKADYRQIGNWLKTNGLLIEEYNSELNKKITLPTKKGMAYGIRAEKRKSVRGIEYMLVIYNKQAQEYIVKNFKNILLN